MSLSLHKKAQSLRYYLFVFPIYKMRFKELGAKTRILSPLSIEGYSNIEIGNNVVIGYKNWLASKSFQVDKGSRLVIGDGCRIGNFNHIYATNEVIIGKNVLTADKVYISDCAHSYEDVFMPVLQQPIKQLERVRIGEGTWIGENVCIIGASVGKGCVVGANSVVNKDIPDFCVAVGIPAKIIKKYNLETGKWEKIKC